MKVAIAFGRGGLLMKAVGGSDTIINYYEAVGRTMNCFCVLLSGGFDPSNGMIWIHGYLFWAFIYQG